MGKIVRIAPRRGKPGGGRASERRGRIAGQRARRRGLVPVALAGLLVALGASGRDPPAVAAGEPVAIISRRDNLAGNILPVVAATGSAERIAARFGRCDGGGAVHCVVDGDTIRIGARRIRLLGFDTPEVHARCEAERRAAERATSALQAWLNRGPFELTLEPGTRPVDRYGRDLRAVQRRTEALSAYMVEGGFARVYGGGRRAGWC